VATSHETLGTENVIESRVKEARLVVGKYLQRSVGAITCGKRKAFFGELGSKPIQFEGARGFIRGSHRGSRIVRKAQR